MTTDVQAFTPGLAAVDAQVQASDVGAVGVAATAQATVQAELTVALARPRDEVVAWTMLEKSCQRPRFASMATFSFPRGGKTVSGPSVVMAREIARCWGRLNSGIDVIAEDETHMTVQGWAWDLQTVRRVVYTQRVKKTQQRVNRQTGETTWVEVDERDKMELAFRVGAKLERNAILRLVPQDVIDDALDLCRQTETRSSAGDIEQNRDQVLRATASSFSKYGVTRKMIEAWLGHDMETVNEEELQKLREIFRGLKEGELTASEAFPEKQEDAVQKRNVAAKKRGASKKKDSTLLDYTEDPG